LIDGAHSEMQRVAEQGGMVQAIENGHVKRELVKSHTERMRAIESGELKIVGVNCYQETAESPLTAGGDSGIMKVDPRAEQDQIAALQAFREVPASIQCAHAGVTTGEWSEVLREVFGEYRAPTGIDIGSGDHAASDALLAVREQVQNTGEELGRPLRLLIGKPGLDGHSNGAEQIAVKGRDAGFEIVYEGIRLTPAQIARAAQEEGVHLIGLSVLSGSHLELVQDIRAELDKIGAGNVPLVIGGIIPEEDAQQLREGGVKAVFTPKDHDLNAIMADMVEIIRQCNGLEAVA
jgi:(2R)-ethylmalonyl-CoA mutase